MSGQSWIIGATSECDIVVNQPTVSSRHCQLIRTPEGLLLKDLGSTNGTYVNGERISSSRLVSASDRITLGTSTPLPWPSHLVSPGSRTVRIGRAATNHVVVEGAGVSDHHAQLTLHDGTMTLEDLGSTAGTGVGSPGRQVTRTTVKIGDTVFLGSTPVQVAAVVDALKGKTVAGQADQQTRAGEGDSAAGLLSYGTGTLIAVAAGGAVLMSLLVALIIYAFGGSGQGPAVASNEQVGMLLSAEPHRKVEPRSSEPTNGAGQDAGAPQKDTADSSTGPQDTPSSAANAKKRPTDALFLVLVGDEADKYFRVGTAWAVGPHTLASSASVVVRLRDLQERFPQVVVFWPTKNERISIVRTKVHPRYVEAAAACDQAEKELDELRTTQGDAAPEELDRERIREAWVEAGLKALKAAERQVYFDAATIEVNQPLDTILPPAPVSDAQALRPNLAVRAMGLAFDFKDPFLDPNSADMAWTLDGRIGRLVSYDKDAPEVQRLLVHLEPARPNQAVRGQLEYTYVGSPVVNEAGQVIGIYSRPTPPREPDQPPDGRSFDATLFERVREVMALEK